MNDETNDAPSGSTEPTDPSESTGQTGSNLPTDLPRAPERVEPIDHQFRRWVRERVLPPLKGAGRDALRHAWAGVLAVLRWGRDVVLRRPLLIDSAVRVALLAVLFAGTLFGAGWLGLRRVPPGTVGVRQSMWGKGIDERDYAPGLYFSLRGLDAWHLVDARTQIVAFAHESDGGNEMMLRVRTKDGNVARVGVSVPYRVADGEAHLLVSRGLRGVWRDLVHASVRKVLLVELAELSSDDFADTELRTERVREALPVLNETLAEYHVRAESVEIRMVFFGTDYENTLQKKQLSRQRARLVEAATEVQDEELAVGRLEADIEREVRELHAAKEQAIADLTAEHRALLTPVQSDAATYRDLRKAEADAEYVTLSAEGDLALKRIGALRTRLRGEAWATAGGRLYLARERARRLQFAEVTLDSTDPRVPSPFDIDALVRLFVGEQGEGRGGS